MSHPLDGLREAGRTHITLGVTDLDGVMRGKTVALDQLTAADGKATICDCVLGWDIDDQLYDRQGYTGWETGYPDVGLTVLPDTLRRVPRIDHQTDPNAAVGAAETQPLVLCEFDGEAAALCPRALLRRVVGMAEGMGFSVRCGFEYEFFLFSEQPTAARRRDYRDLKPVTDGNFGYTVLRIAGQSRFHDGLIAWCEALGAPLTALHTENGPGLWEAALAPADALEAADRAAIFRTYLKVYGLSHGLMPTFMAKWSPTYQGQGGHIHISLTHRDTGQPAFFDDAREAAISQTMHHFLGGQQRFLPEFAVLSAPTINSYKRLCPDTWAPTSATWGIDNRTCALRVVGRSPGSRRVEFRVPGSDANPYLALAAAVLTGLEGIRGELEPGPATEGNAYAPSGQDHARLPGSLAQATALFRDSALARTHLGAAFVDQFCLSREWEVARFAAAVTDWELDRYFEAI